MPQWTSSQTFFESCFLSQDGSKGEGLQGPHHLDVIGLYKNLFKLNFLADLRIFLRISEGAVMRCAAGDDAAEKTADPALLARCVLELFGACANTRRHLRSALHCMAMLRSSRHHQRVRAVSSRSSNASRSPLRGAMPRTIYRAMRTRLPPPFDRSDDRRCDVAVNSFLLQQSANECRRDPVRLANRLRDRHEGAIHLCDICALTSSTCRCSSLRGSLLTIVDGSV